MRLVHYSVVQHVDVRSVTQDEHRGHKPCGFWVSDESEYGWSKWTEVEEYGIAPNAFAVTLADEPNVLTLTTVESILAFHEEFKETSRRRYIDWARVADRWRGIIITPYQWELRLSFEVNWYYTWDCASGCIWDAAAIASVEPVNVAAVAS